MHCQFNLSFGKRKNTHELHLLVVLRFVYFRGLNYWVECRRAESASENQGDISFPWGFSRREGLRGPGIAVTWANTTLIPFNSIIPYSPHLGAWWLLRKGWAPCLVLDSPILTLPPSSPANTSSSVLAGLGWAAQVLYYWPFISYP